MTFCPIPFSRRRTPARPAGSSRGVRPFLPSLLLVALALGFASPQGMGGKSAAATGGSGPNPGSSRNPDPGAPWSRTVDYRIGQAFGEGYLALDPGKAHKRPGVLLLHEWMGPTAHERSRADSLARLGYIALVADLYGKGVRPKNPQEAGAEAGKLKGDRKLLRERARAALDFLRSHPLADSSKVAVMGFCFGGTAALELARSGAPVQGTACFHGHLDTPNPADAARIRGKVIVFQGAADPHVPAAQVEAFQKEMTAAKVDWQMVLFGGAVHSFTNPKAGDDPKKGAAYDAKADRRSFDALLGFFAEIFG